MTGVLRDYCYEYLHLCAKLRHIKKYDVDDPELEEHLLDQIECLKTKMIVEISKNSREK